jgi:maleate isomerase
MISGRPTRIAVVLPSLNTTLEPDLAGLGLSDVTFHFGRIPLKETTPDGLASMNSAIDGAADLLADVRPDLCLYGCTSGSFFDGLSGVDGLVDRLQRKLGCPVVATSKAVASALGVLGAERVALATPYLAEIDKLEIGFLSAMGFEVTASRGLGLSGREVQDVSTAQIEDLAVAVDSDEAQAVFISCTNLRALEVIDSIELRLAKPVVSSNQALI